MVENKKLFVLDNTSIIHSTSCIKFRSIITPVHSTLHPSFFIKKEKRAWNDNAAIILRNLNIIHNFVIYKSFTVKRIYIKISTVNVINTPLKS